MSATWEIRKGDVLDRLREMPDCSVHCCVTSPPYFGLRDYGAEGQIGLEPTPDEYVATMVAVFAEVRRVLRDDGTLWLNLGDSYAGSWGAQSRGAVDNGTSTIEGAEKRAGSPLSGRQIMGSPKGSRIGTIRAAGCKPKDLYGIPWMVAFALRADGWFLRCDIIWTKPNPMPSSVTDRPTIAHEYIFLLAKSRRYYYDASAIREPFNEPEGPYGTRLQVRPGVDTRGGNQASGEQWRGYLENGGRNKRSVWEIATQPYSEAHFATFPPKLVEPMVLAGSAPQTCAECGAPWERQTEREIASDREGRIRPEQREDGRATGLSPHRGTRASYSLQTTGWTATCDHADGGGAFDGA